MSRFLNLCLWYAHAHGTFPAERRGCKPIKWQVQPQFTCQNLWLQLSATPNVRTSSMLSSTMGDHFSTFSGISHKLQKYICTAQIKYSIVHAEVSHDIQLITFTAYGSQTFTSTIARISLRSLNIFQNFALQNTKEHRVWEATDVPNVACFCSWKFRWVPHVPHTPEVWGNHIRWCSISLLQTSSQFTVHVIHLWLLWTVATCMCGVGVWSLCDYRIVC